MPPDQTAAPAGAPEQADQDTPEHFADRLLRAVEEKGTPLIVGLDPIFSQLPAAMVQELALDDADDSEAVIDGLLEFSRRVIRIVAPLVAAVKVNIACFEPYLWDGYEAYNSVVQEAAGNGLMVIGDVKRGDVGHTAQQYAQATLSNPRFSGMQDLVNPDAVTVNSYFGSDGVEPFVQAANASGKGVFTLVRTSNPSSGQVQEIIAQDGQPVYMHIARLVEQWGAPYVGARGYSLLGAVAGATHAQQLAALREAMPHTLFLVPGYGAQGGTAADVAKAFKADGTGAIINAGRSIIFAYNQPRWKPQNPEDWRQSIENALRQARQEIGVALGKNIAN